MGRQARSEIEKFANEASAVAHERIAVEYAAKKNQVLAQLRLKGNSGGYVPALTEWAAERVRDTILARANAYVEAFTLHGVPSDARAETDLQTAAQQIAAGAISGVRGQLDLLKKRTKMPLNNPGGHLNREIGAAMKSALLEGVLRLKRQRIKFRNSDEPLQPITTAVSHARGKTASSTQAFGGTPKADEVALAQPATATNVGPPERGEPGSVHKPDKGMLACPSGDKRKRVRRNARYERIDEVLRQIAEARPKSHEEVFRLLDDRKVALPNRRLFKSAGGWLMGLQHNRHTASAWLSQAWARLGLPAFPRGPKK
jgi:hypothetical protein